MLEETAALNTDDLPQPAIPDRVYDKHTTEGRKRGRGMDHFKQEASQLNNKSEVVPFTPPKVRTRVRRHAVRNFSADFCGADGAGGEPP